MNLKRWAKELEVEFDLHSKNAKDDMRTEDQRQSSKRKAEIAEVLFESLRRATHEDS